MSDKVYKPGDVIPVGYEGEENARTAYIDIAPLREMWPQAAVQLLIVRPKESVPYPAAIADEGDRIAWTIRAEDAAITGHGSYQVLMRDSEGGILGKSTIGATMIKTSLPASTGETPEAAKSWVSEVLDAAKRAEDAAERAENAGGTGGGGGLPDVTPEDEGKVLTVIGGAWAAAQLPKYDGEYEVVPQAHGAVTLETAQKYMDANVTVTKIPYFETSNATGGETAYIASEVEIYGD